MLACLLCLETRQPQTGVIDAALASLERLVCHSNISVVSGAGESNNDAPMDQSLPFRRESGSEPTSVASS